MDKIEKDKMKKHILKILPKYLRNFYGFGNPNAEIWFIGMEPGGGNSSKEIKELLISWEKCGAKNYINIVEYHKNIKKSKHLKSRKYSDLAEYFFGKNNKLQSTWNKLIAISKPEFDRENRRKFQRLNWGRIQSKNCLIELLPLPAPKTSDWNYNKWYPNISFLSRRDLYEKEILEERKKFIKENILKYKPKVVVFYGKRYLKYWEDISGCEFKNDHFPKNQNIIFVMANHPRRSSLKYFKDIGNKIKNIIPRGI